MTDTVIVSGELSIVCHGDGGKTVFYNDGALDESQYNRLFVQVYVIDLDWYVADDKGVFECMFNSETNMLHIPNHVLTYLTKNGIPFDLTNQGLVMGKKHLALLLLKED